jgi:DNA-binding beta-propeller fold protein YncE
MLDRRLFANVLLASTFLVAAAPARAQDAHHGKTTTSAEAGDDDDVATLLRALSRRVGGNAARLDRLERKLDRLLALLEKSGGDRTIPEAEVPNAVFGAFKRAYPNAKAFSWSKDGDAYAVKLEDAGNKLEAGYAEDGTSLGARPLAAAPAPAKASGPAAAEPPAKRADLPKEREIALPGEGSWDYVTVDPAAARLYVAHLTATDVIDLAKNEKIGEVKGIDGAHGTAIVSDLKRGFASSGRNNKLVVFDTETLAVTNQIDTGVGPDAVLHVSSQGEVWTMNHKGATITCVDAKSLEVKKTIEVGGALEFAREDAAKGMVYVNVEDKDLLVTINAKTHEVTNRYAVAPGKEPAGLALDAKDGLLFIGCDNKKLVIMDAQTGKVLGALDSGEHCDGCAFDAETGNVVASCRGNSWVFHVSGNTTTVLGALDAGKTCTIDPRTHRIYVTAGTRGEKDSVKVLVFAQPHAEESARRERPAQGARTSRIDRLKAAVPLTDEQIAKATAVEQQMYADMDKARQDSGQDRAARAEKMTALINKMRTDIRALLAADQLAKYDEWVKKEEADYQASQQRGRRGNGGEGGGNGGDTRPVNGHPDKTIALGTGGFDYVNAVAASRRLYVAHSSKIDVIDMDKDEKVGEVTGVDGAHGTAIAVAAKHGFATAGRKQKLIAFDLDTNEVLKEIDTGSGPDAAVYVPSVDEAWSINHRGGDVTCVDAKTMEVKATVEVGGTLEFAAELGDKVFVNVEDRSTIAAIDAKKHEVVARYDVAPGEGPAGLASDTKDGLIFAGCHNKKLVAMDGATGKVVATFDIGQGCDAVAFDPVAGKVYASCGDGTTTVVEVKSPTTFGAVTTVETARGGKCCSVDSKTHKLYVAVAPRRNEQGGESRVLVFAPKPVRSPD